MIWIFVKFILTLAIIFSFPWAFDHFHGEMSCMRFWFQYGPMWTTPVILIWAFPWKGMLWLVTAKISRDGAQ